MGELLIYHIPLHGMGPVFELAHSLKDFDKVKTVAICLLFLRYWRNIPCHMTCRMSIDESLTSDKRRRLLHPFAATSQAASSPSPPTSNSSSPSMLATSMYTTTSEAPTAPPSSHPFSAGFQAKLKLASISRATGSAISGLTGSRERDDAGSASTSTGASTSGRRGLGHGRTPSASQLAKIKGKGGQELQGAQVVRTPSDARRGVMKTRLEALGADADVALETATAGHLGKGAERMTAGSGAGASAVPLSMPFGVAGPLGDVHAATAALQRMSSLSRGSGRSGDSAANRARRGRDKSSPAADAGAGAGAVAGESDRTETPPSSMIGSAELPMMEECDRRVSLPSPPPAPVVVPIIATPIPPVRSYLPTPPDERTQGHRSLAKAPSLPTITQLSGENGSPTHTKPLRILPKVRPAAADAFSDVSVGARVEQAVSRSSGKGERGAKKYYHTAEPVPAGLTRQVSITRKPSLSSTIESTFKPLPPTKPATRGTDDFEANVKIIDVIQRPAPTAEDDVLIRLEFAYDLSSTSGAGELAMGGMTIPIDVLRRAPSKLLDHIEAYLDTLTVGPRTTARNSELEGSTSEESRGSRPSMTDGESAESSDVESDADADTDAAAGEAERDPGEEVREMDAYGAEDILRNEYLKSLWIPSPTHLSLPPSLTPRSLSSIPPLPLPSPPSSAVQLIPYPTRPTGRARTRNQYTQHPSSSSTSALAYPAPSTALLPLAASLSMRRRATYIALPKESLRGVVTEVKVWMGRDRGVWGRVMGRVLSGRWSWNDRKLGERREGEGCACGAEEKRTRGLVRRELEWAGMDYLLSELDELDQLQAKDAEDLRHTQGSKQHPKPAEEPIDDKPKQTLLQKELPKPEKPPASLVHVIATTLSAHLPTPPISLFSYADDSPPTALAPTPYTSDVSRQARIMPSISTSPPAGRAPIEPARRMSMYHKPTQSPPIVPSLSVTPPAENLSPIQGTASTTSTAGISISPDTPAHLTAYPFPDQPAIAPQCPLIQVDSSPLAVQALPHRTVDKAETKLPMFPQPPPRPSMSALRPESRRHASKTLVPQITDLSTVPGAGEDKKERQKIGVNEDMKERRVSRRTSVVRFAGGKGVRNGGAGYI